MRIVKVKPSSKCKDGALVKEYTLNSPVNEQDISALSGLGALVRKDIGGNELFTFTSEILSLKGMTGDTVVYLTHRKEDTEATDQFMNEVFG